MDPVPILQQEIDIVMSNLKKSLANREDMLNDRRGGNIDIFNTLGIQMLNDTQYLRTSLGDISESIEVVKHNMSDYNIPESTIIQREQYVRSNLAEIKRIEESIQAQNNRISTIHKSTAFSGPQSFINNNNNQQSLSQLVKEEELENLHYTASMQKVIANQIKDELNDQQNLILALDNDVTNADEAMKRVTNQIKRLMEIEGKTPTMLVAILSVVFIILLFIVV